MKANGANNGPSPGREKRRKGRREGEVVSGPDLSTVHRVALLARHVELCDQRQGAEGTGHRAQGTGQLLAQQSPFNLFCSRGSSPLSLMSLALTIIAAHVAYT